MPIRCKASNTGSDVRCRVCGQGFLVYWTPSSRLDRGTRIDEILQTLRDHHQHSDAPEAHPRVEFHSGAEKPDPELAVAA